jgi:hypothetical protein
MVPRLKLAQDWRRPFVVIMRDAGWYAGLELAQ